MKHISIMIFLVGFLLFRPYQMQENGMMYAGDDYSYFAHATSLVFGQYPSYQKEYTFTDDGGGRPMHSIGPGLMAAPFVFIFSMVDRLTGNPIVRQRLGADITPTWTLYGFVIASIFYLWLGCFLLYTGLRNYFQERESVLAVFLMVICQGIPLFAFRRPVFSHIFEFSAMSMLVYWMLLPNEQWSNWSKGYRGALGVGIVIALLELVRLNDIMMVVIWPLILFAVKSGSQERGGILKKLIMAYAAAGALIVGFYVLPALLSHSHKYSDIAHDKLLNFYPPLFYLHRLWHILTGIDWGLIYTAPFILMGLLSAIFFKYPLRRMVLLGILPLLVNLYILLSWKTQGGWYGYRYLIPVASPLLIYPLALFLTWAGKRWGRGTVLGLSLVLCLLPLLSMLAFEGNSSLSLTNTMEYFKTSDWGNNTYQLNVWQTLIEEPKSFAVAVLKGGPLYVFYCFKALGHQSGSFLASVKKQYPYFSSLIFLRTLFIYFFPFLLYFIFSRAPKKKCPTAPVSDI